MNLLTLIQGQRTSSQGSQEEGEKKTALLLSRRIFPPFLFINVKNNILKLYQCGVVVKSVGLVSGRLWFESPLMPW